jgi:hypothetical protein
MTINTMIKLTDRLKDDRGAVVVEASLSLPVFMFAIFIILSIVNICYVQAKVATALGSATKELSQYTYIYYALNGDKLQDSLLNSAADMDALFSDIDQLSSTKPPSSFEDVENTYDTATDLTDRLKNYADDPASAIVGLFAEDLNDTIDRGKNELGGLVVRYLMEKNLTENGRGGADRFLRNLHVINGMDGLQLDATIVPSGERYISITVEYEVQVLQLLNIENNLHFKQTATTQAWGLGE